ncbi:MAG: beta 1-4 rhamnosyltransferase Cps2T [Anaerostipes sp.]|jgi:rhamnosyltransferase
MEKVQHVFLIGAKSLGAYGGYETFINKLTEYHQNDTRIKYHVACKANGAGCMDESKTEGISNIIKDKDGNTREFTYHNARCFKIKIPEKLGSAQAIYYDVKALKESCKYIRENHINHPIIYIMACRIGPFMKHYYKEIHKLGGKIYINPDGHEWMRAKWSAPIRKYWKVSEQMMVKWSDLEICDSINIEKYIHKCYDGKGIKGRNPKTTFIAYGAETRKSKLADNDQTLLDWYESKNIKPHEYYLVVGRFVPENNYETMIREFMLSHSKKDFAIITNVNEKFLEELEKKLHYKNDKRIKFVGTVYDQELLMKIRENAYGYFHGHEVGGTNPSLLEALGSTDLNLLLDVGFNKEVARENALYWNKQDKNLAKLIDNCDQMDNERIVELGSKAKQRITDSYSWDYITDKYKRVFV